MLTMGGSDDTSFSPFPVPCCSLEGRTVWFPCLWTSIVAPTEQGVAGKAPTRQPTCPVDPAPQAKESGIRARHLLFDSWFAFPVTILRRLLAKGMPYYLHAQAMVDRTSFTIFLQKQFMVDPSHQSFPLKFDLRSRFGDGGSFE